MQKILFFLLFASSLLGFSQISFAGTECLDASIPVQLQEPLTAATQNIPCTLISSLQTIELFDDETLPRAMANARILKVNTNALDDEELVNVLIHELGHVVDLGYLVSSEYSSVSGFMDGHENVYADDKSVQFYTFSWSNEKTRKSDAIVQDFAGEYASTDPFEDFAEGFLLYVQHGNAFRKMARHNAVMAQKYNFFKETIFTGVEFNTGTRKISAEKRIWDITKM